MSETKKHRDKNKIKDDNLLSAFAHISALFLPFVIPLIIWLLQKDKSKYVEYQSKQALVFQIISWASVTVLSLVATLLSFFCIGFILWPILILVGIGAAVYSIYAAWETLNGRDFRYAYIDQII